MEVFRWLGTNWFEALQSLGIVSGFLFTAHMIRRNTAVWQIANLIALGEAHHSIWKQLLERPELSRVRDHKADLDVAPLTVEERVFVTSLITHLSTVHRASLMNMLVGIQGLDKDIGDFFSLPIPRTVWITVREFQDQDFVAFVESRVSLNSKQ